MNDDIEQNWAIFRRTSKADVFLGRVEASDEQTAIATAIEKLAVTNRYHQRALVARKVEGIGLDDKPEYCDCGLWELMALTRYAIYSQRGRD